MGAAYGLVGASGNLTAGLIQLTGAITGDVNQASQMANAASTVTTAGGFIMLMITKGDLEATSTAAAFESLGTAGYNGGLKVNSSMHLQILSKSSFSLQTLANLSLMRSV